MKYSHNWLQEYIVEKLPTSKIIEDALNAKAFEVEGVEEIKYFESVNSKQDEEENIEKKEIHGLEKIEIVDFVYDIKVLPNRAHDALGHIGMARELAACLDLTFKKEEIEKYESSENYNKIKLENEKDILNNFDKSIEKVSLKILEDKSCTRFMAVRIDGIVVGESPDWLKNKLESIDQRNINNIVDITNYVQYTLNKPMHAYDASNVVGGLHARYANENEILVTLDDKELILNNTANKKEGDMSRERVLVISDDEKALGLAGIKGGKYSGINSGTTSIILESANFNPVLIRKTSQKYNIKTDASKRFENGISDTLVESGLYMTISKILKLFPDAKIGEVSDTQTREIKNYRSGVTLKSVNDILGSNISEKELENILKRLGFEYEKVNAIEKLKELIKICEDKPYKRGASVLYDTPNYFDCSSFTNYLFRESYEHIPRVSIDQYVFSKEIKKEDLKFGDLIFTNTKIIKTKESPIFSQVLGAIIQDSGTRTESLEFIKGTKVEGGIDHVAFYINDNNIIHAASSNGRVTIEKLEESNSFSNEIYCRRPFKNLEGFSYIISVPNERLDLRSKEDLVEEIGRIYGYEKLIPTLPDLKSKNIKEEAKKNNHLVHDSFKLENKIGQLNNTLNIQNTIRNILNKNYIDNSRFSEVITYSLTQKGDIKLAKSASDKNSLRTNISDGLLEAINKNLNNMPLLNLDIIKMYEFGSVFSLEDKKNENKNENEEKSITQKIKENINLSIAIGDNKKKNNFKEAIENIILEIKNKLELDNIDFAVKSEKPYIVEINFSELLEKIESQNFNNEKKLKNLENNKNIDTLAVESENILLELSVEEKDRLENLKYKSFSQMPFIVRDIAFWCEVSTDKLEILELIKNSAGDLCVGINIFDEFTKEIEIKSENINENKENTSKENGNLENITTKKIMKSLGYRLVYQDVSRTLTDEEVNMYSDNVYKILKDKNFEVR